MESSVAQSVHNGFEKETWQPQGYVTEGEPRREAEGSIAPSNVTLYSALEVTLVLFTVLYKLTILHCITLHYIRWW